MNTNIRTAEIDDLDFINELENESFNISRQSHRSSLKNSIKSEHQKVYVAEITDNNKIIKAGLIILFLYKKTLRIYSIAVKEQYRSKGIGEKLIRRAIYFANVNSYEKMTIEVDVFNEELVQWYIKKGFENEKTLLNYYGEYESAYRMSLTLNKKRKRLDKYVTRNLIVAESEIDWLENIPNIELILAEVYIEDPEYQRNKPTRVFNLCNSYEYQDIGYYVSLLASARDQRTIPNEININDFSKSIIIERICQDMNNLIQKSFFDIKGDEISLNIFFGQNKENKYEKISKELYNSFSFPLMNVKFKKNSIWTIKKITPLYPEQIDENEKKYARKSAENFFRQKRFAKIRFKHYKYNLAILVDPSETDPPSCGDAIKKFISAAEKIGFFVEMITKDDYNRLKEFDALFIRATTSVSGYTYQFSRQAYADGLVVIDDPWAIMRCSNKIYIEERMKKSNISTPKSWIFTRKKDIEEQIKDIYFPLVLKKPDSCFSLGVFKVNNKKEFLQKIEEMFKTSDLVMGQEYLFSTYDWRIGIIDHKPLFVCRYYMAKDHWQIYNWDKAGTDDNSGYVDTLKIDEGPAKVIETAIRATKLVGDGLYGVDLKEIDGKVYLIEINDNPSIDSGIEDRILEDDIYSKIMVSLMKRIEIARNIPRYISEKPYFK